MVTAVVLINADSDNTSELAQAVAAIDGVQEVFSVAGRYDLVAIVRVKQNEDLPDIVATKLKHLVGITRTETLIAFRGYSARELEHGYALGLD